MDPAPFSMEEQYMYEKLDRLREEVKRAEKRKQDADNKLRTAQAKLKEAENSQILSDVGELNLSPEQVGQFLQMIRNGTLPDAGMIRAIVEDGNNSAGQTNQAEGAAGRYESDDADSSIAAERFSYDHGGMNSSDSDKDYESEDREDTVDE